MEKIKKMSRALKRFSQFFLWILPVFNLGFWITNGYPSLKALGLDLSPIPKFSFLQPLENLALWQKFCGFFVTMIPIGFACLSLFWIQKLFSYFSTLKIFSLESVRCLRNFAFTLLLSQLIFPIYVAMISFVLTITNPIGERIIVMQFGVMQLILVGVALSIFLVSWVMEEGRKLDEEVKGTI